MQKTKKIAWCVRGLAGIVGFVALLSAIGVIGWHLLQFWKSAKTMGNFFSIIGIHHNVFASLFTVLGVLATVGVACIAIYTFKNSIRDKRRDEFAAIFWNFIKRLNDVKTEVMGQQVDKTDFTRGTAFNMALTPILVDYYDNKLYLNEADVSEKVSNTINELTKDHFLGDIFRTILATAEHIQENAIDEADKTKYLKLFNELLSFEDHCLVYFFSKNTVNTEYVQRIADSHILRHWDLSGMDKKYVLKYIKK